jgi:hypothetical protein
MHIRATLAGNLVPAVPSPKGLGLTHMLALAQPIVVDCDGPERIREWLLKRSWPMTSNPYRAFFGRIRVHPTEGCADASYYADCGCAAGFS